MSQKSASSSNSYYGNFGALSHVNTVVKVLKREHCVKIGWDNMCCCLIILDKKVTCQASKWILAKENIVSIC